MRISIPVSLWVLVFTEIKYTEAFTPPNLQNFWIGSSYGDSTNKLVDLRRQTDRPRSSLSRLQSTPGNTNDNADPNARLIRSAYLQWCEHYKKQVDETRYLQFVSNYKVMQSIALKGGKPMHLNEFADFTGEEYEALMQNKNMPKNIDAASVSKVSQPKLARKQVERKEAINRDETYIAPKRLVVAKPMSSATSPPPKKQAKQPQSKPSQQNPSPQTSPMPPPKPEMSTPSKTRTGETATTTENNTFTGTTRDDKLKEQGKSQPAMAGKESIGKTAIPPAKANSDQNKIDTNSKKTHVLSQSTSTLTEGDEGSVKLSSEESTKPILKKEQTDERKSSDTSDINGNQLQQSAQKQQPQPANEQPPKLEGKMENSSPPPKTPSPENSSNVLDPFHQSKIAAGIRSTPRKKTTLFDVMKARANAAEKGTKQKTEDGRKFTKETLVEEEKTRNTDETKAEVGSKKESIRTEAASTRKTEADEEKEAKKKAEEERKQKEVEARRKSDEERQRLELEAKKKAEEERKQKEAEAKAKAEARHKADEERKRLELEAKKRAEGEQKQKEAEAKAKAEARRKADEERKRLELEAKKKAEEEQKQKEAEAKAKAEARRKADEERKRLELEAKKKAEEEAKRKEAEAKAKAEARRKADEERKRLELEAKKKAEGEQKQKEAEAKAKAEARRKADEERKRLELEAKKKAEEEAKRKEAEAKAKAEARRKADEERKRLELEAKRKADEERQRKEVEARAKAEARRKAEEERKRIEAEAKAEAEAKRKAEEERKRIEAEAKAKAEAEAKRKAEEERKRIEAEAKAKAEAEAKRKAEEEMKRIEAEAKAKAEAEARRKAEEERKRIEAEVKAKAEAEARRKAEEERKRIEAEVKAKAEARRKAEEERKRMEAEAKAKAEAEAKRKADEERQRKEAEAKAKAEVEARRKAEEKRIQIEAEAKAKAEARRKAEEERKRKEAEAKAKAEAEAKRKAEEERKRIEAEAKAKAEAEAETKRKAEEERKRLEAEAKAKAEAEAEAKRKAEEERKRKEAEAKAEAEAEAKRKAEERKRIEAEAKAKAEAEAEAKRKAEEERKQIEAKAKAKAEAEAKRKAELERKRILAEAEAEALAKTEAEARQKKAEELRLRIEAEEKARAVEEEKKKIEEEKQRMEAEAKAKAELEAKQKEAEAVRLRIESEEKARALEQEKKKVEDAKAKTKAELEAKRKTEEIRMRIQGEEISRAEREIQKEEELELEAEAEATRNTYAEEETPRFQLEPKEENEIPNHENDISNDEGDDEVIRKEELARLEATVKLKAEIDAKQKVEEEKRKIEEEAKSEEAKKIKAEEEAEDAKRKEEEDELRIRAAYLDWCLEFAKKPDKVRIKQFKQNYLMLEGVAKEEGKEIKLNEYADYTAVEYRSEMKEKQEVKKKEQEERLKNEQEEAEAAFEAAGGKVGMTLVEEESNETKSNAFQQREDNELFSAEGEVAYGDTRAEEVQDEWWKQEEGLDESLLKTENTSWSSMNEGDKNVDTKIGNGARATNTTPNVDADDPVVRKRVRTAYSGWCRMYNKEPDEARFPKFKSNYLIMERLAKKQGREVFLNEFADCTPDEYEKASRSKSVGISQTSSQSPRKPKTEQATSSETFSASAEPELVRTKRNIYVSRETDDEEVDQAAVIAEVERIAMAKAEEAAKRVEAARMQRMEQRGVGVSREISAEERIKIDREAAKSELEKRREEALRIEANDIANANADAKKMEEKLRRQQWEKSQIENRNSFTQQQQLRKDGDRTKKEAEVEKVVGRYEVQQREGRTPAFIPKETSKPRGNGLNGRISDFDSEETQPVVKPPTVKAENPFQRRPTFTSPVKASDVSQSNVGSDFGEYNPVSWQDTDTAFDTDANPLGNDIIDGNSDQIDGNSTLEQSSLMPNGSTYSASSSTSLSTNGSTVSETSKELNESFNTFSSFDENDQDAIRSLNSSTEKSEADDFESKYDGSYFMNVSSNTDEAPQSFDYIQNWSASNQDGSDIDTSKQTSSTYDDQSIANESIQGGNWYSNDGSQGSPNGSPTNSFGGRSSLMNKGASYLDNLSKTDSSTTSEVTNGGDSFSNGVARQESPSQAQNVFPERIKAAYRDWCQYYGKEYNESRLSTFSSNFLAVERYHRETGVSLILNELADMSSEEFQQNKN